MTLIERIVWDEFVQAKSWEQYISDYTGYKMDWRKWFSIITGALVVIGSSTWSVWNFFEKSWVAPVVLLIVGITQILASSLPQIIVDNETLKSLSRLRGMYIGYSNKLERLLLKILNKNLSQEEIEEQYFALRETVYPIEELKDAMNIRQLKKLSKKIENRIDIMLKARYLTNIED